MSTVTVKRVPEKAMVGIVMLKNFMKRVLRQKDPDSFRLIATL